MVKVKTLHRVVALKRHDDELIEGTTYWDGLNDLLAVTTDSGETAYVALPLDNIIYFAPMPEAR